MKNVLPIAGKVLLAAIPVIIGIAIYDYALSGKIATLKAKKTIKTTTTV